MKRRTWMLGALAAPVLMTTLAGCASPPAPADYATQTPALDLRSYFNGNLTAHGLFTDRAGRVVKRFKVLMRCQWTGDDGVLDEAFTYSDGSTQRRIWRLKKLPDGRYTGQADDVVGTASGQQSGNAFQWGYTLRLPVDGREFEVQFDDWMFLMSPEVMLNKAVMSKWGVRLGEVTLVFIKPGATPSTSP